MTKPLLVGVGDALASGYCSGGVRVFADRYGLDWDQFLSPGVPVESLPDNALCARAIAAAKKRAARGGRLSDAAHIKLTAKAKRRNPHGW